MMFINLVLVGGIIRYDVEEESRHMLCGIWHILICFWIVRIPSMLSFNNHSTIQCCLYPVTGIVVESVKNR